MENMHCLLILYSLFLYTLPILTAPSRNLTSFAAINALPYPAGYSMKNCPATGNAWTTPQSQTNPRARRRSFAPPPADSPSTAHLSPFLLSTRDKAILSPQFPHSKRQQSPLCNGVARQNFNYNGIESGYPTASVLLQAGIQYVVSFSSNNPVLGVTVYQAAVGSALNHIVSRPNFARTASGTLTFTLKQAANVWLYLKFATGMPAQGELGIFALNTPSEMNLESGSGGL